MRIFLHDYAGHPFQAQLSRALAARGHLVTHAWFAGDIGPKGTLTRGSDDPAGIAFLPIGAGLGYSKSNYLKRRQGDILYGRLLTEAFSRGGYDVVISGNTPTEAQEPLVAACNVAGTPFLYWCQDFYSIATSTLLGRKLPGPGHLVGAWYRFLERRQMRRSAQIVHITESFRAQTDRWGIPRERVSVIPNWGALDEIALMPRDNPWAAAQGLPDGPRYVYSGTLAMKHNPELVAALAKDCAERGTGTVLLVSVGVGATSLAARTDLPRLKRLPLAPFEVFPQVLGAADVLLAVIEREAGRFSVPSKLLSYLCAGRPIVLAAPADNLAARMVLEAGAGKVVEPEDIAGFVAAAQFYASNPAFAARAGASGRAYAETRFDLEKIADRFEAVFAAALQSREPACPSLYRIRS